MSKSRFIVTAFAGSRYIALGHVQSQYLSQRLVDEAKIATSSYLKSRLVVTAFAGSRYIALGHVQRQEGGRDLTEGIQGDVNRGEARPRLPESDTSSRGFQRGHSQRCEASCSCERLPEADTSSRCIQRGVRQVVGAAAVAGKRYIVSGHSQRAFTEVRRCSCERLLDELSGAMPEAIVVLSTPGGPRSAQVRQRLRTLSQGIHRGVKYVVVGGGTTVVAGKRYIVLGTPVFENHILASKIEPNIVRIPARKGARVGLAKQ
ncbi:hypothetical protein B0H34DRAFT_677131 [Crassisporium funariophilum]|nr:hypothetical protein B0H34DRAFT_677131 [Crassisporium funariophilum]